MCQWMLRKDPVFTGVVRVFDGGIFDVLNGARHPIRHKRDSVMKVRESVRNHDARAGFNGLNQRTAKNQTVVPQLVPDRRRAEGSRLKGQGSRTSILIQGRD
jgi:hypothetical protein